MADYDFVTDVTQQPTRVPGFTGLGQVRASGLDPGLHVGTTTALQGHWPDSVLVNENLVPHNVFPEEANTLSVRMPERGSVNALTSFLESSLSSMFRPKCYRQNDRIDRRIISRFRRNNTVYWKIKRY